MMMARHLPMETLEHIVEFIPTNDLFHLSITQRILGAIAERRLYQNVTILTNAEKIIRGPWFEGTEKWVVCLRQSVLAQLALKKRPHRYKYVRSISLDGRYHCAGRYRISRLHRGGILQVANLEDVIDPVCLVRMVNLCNVECMMLRIEPSFRHILYTIKGLNALHFDRCSFQSPDGLEVTDSAPPSSQIKVRLTRPLGTCGWTSYVHMGVKDLEMGKHEDATRSLGTLCSKGILNSLTSLKITLDIPDEGFAAALSEILSSSEVLISMAIELSNPHSMPTFTLPNTAIPGLRSFSGSLDLAPIFIKGRPVESVDLKISASPDDENISTNMFSFLRSSSTKITDLRLYSNLDAHPTRERWQQAIDSLPVITPALQKLLLGAVPTTTVFKRASPEAFVTAGLPRLASLVELHFDSKRLFDETFDQTLSARELKEAFRKRLPCKRRDQIISICEKACPSLRRIVFGEGRGWGGFEKLDNDGWVMFVWDEPYDFWRVDAVDLWPMPRPDAHSVDSGQEAPAPG